MNSEIFTWLVVSKSSSNLSVFLLLKCIICQKQFLFVIFYKSTEAATSGFLCKKGVLKNFTKFAGKHLC